METGQYEITTGGYWTQAYEDEADTLPEALQLAGTIWEAAKRRRTVQVWSDQKLLVTFDPVDAEVVNYDDDDEETSDIDSLETVELTNRTTDLPRDEE